MVALFGFFKLPQVLVEFFLGGEGHAVEPLQLRVIFVAAPVSPGDAHQLERADLAGILDVRPPAQVHEIAGLVKRNLCYPLSSSTPTASSSPVSLATAVLPFSLKRLRSSTLNGWSRLAISSIAASIGISMRS